MSFLLLCIKPPTIAPAAIIVEAAIPNLPLIEIFLPVFTAVSTDCSAVCFTGLATVSTGFSRTSFPAFLSASKCSSNTFADSSALWNTGGLSERALAA